MFPDNKEILDHKVHRDHKDLLDPRDHKDHLFQYTHIKYQGHKVLQQTILDTPVLVILKFQIYLLFLKQILATWQSTGQ
ncbi:MAG: hypothetical protein EBU23_16680 [Mycobacteriaceae bacterium]|nr:hypothetical protein [Mycobacteriaceae bacterium]